MKTKELIERIEQARLAAIADRDEANRQSTLSDNPGVKNAWSMTSAGHHAVAVALGRILEK